MGPVHWVTMTPEANSPCQKYFLPTGGTSEFWKSGHIDILY